MNNMLSLFFMMINSDGTLQSSFLTPTNSPTAKEEPIKPPITPKAPQFQPEKPSEQVITPNISKSPQEEPLVITHPTQPKECPQVIESTKPFYTLETCSGCDCIPENSQGNSLSNEFHAALCLDNLCNFKNLKNPVLKSYLDKITSCHSTMLTTMGKTCSTLGKETCPGTLGLIESLNKLPLKLRNYTANVMTMMGETGASYQKKGPNALSICHAAMVGQVVMNRSKETKRKQYVNPTLGGPPYSLINTAMARSQFAMSLFNCDQQRANSDNYKNYINTLQTFCNPSERHSVKSMTSIVSYLLLNSSTKILQPQSFVTGTTNFVSRPYYNQQATLARQGTPGSNWSWMKQHQLYEPKCTFDGLSTVNISDPPPGIRGASSTVFFAH